MSLPFDPADVVDYEWMNQNGNVIGVGLTLTDRSIRVIKGAQLTPEVIAFVQKKIGPPA